MGQRGPTFANNHAGCPLSSWLCLYVCVCVCVCVVGMAWQEGIIVMEGAGGSQQ